MRTATTRGSWRIALRQGGFTLIEATVALALVGLIAVGLFESLRFAQRAHFRIVDRGSLAWHVFASQRFLRSLIESAYPRETLPTETVPIFGIEGDDDRIALLATTSLASGDAGLSRYEIAVRRNSLGMSDLVVRWRLEPAPDGGRTAGALEETLVENVADVEWAYLEHDDTSRGVEGRWLDGWRGRQQLPRLVRLRVSFASADPRRWPELVVAPRLTDDANCSFDVVAQRCRAGS